MKVMLPSCSECDTIGSFDDGLIDGIILPFTMAAKCPECGEVSIHEFGDDDSDLMNPFLSMAYGAPDIEIDLEFEGIDDQDHDGYDYGQFDYVDAVDDAFDDDFDDEFKPLGNLSTPQVMFGIFIIVCVCVIIFGE